MTAKHEVDGPDRTPIPDYLAATFGPKPPGRPPSPFLQKTN